MRTQVEISALWTSFMDFQQHNIDFEVPFQFRFLSTYEETTRTLGYHSLVIDLNIVCH